MYNNKINLGKRLKELRGDTDINTVSKRSGVPVDYLLRLEDGTKVMVASPNALYKLAAYYKCELNELLILGGVIIPKPEKDKGDESGNVELKIDKMTLPKDGQEAYELMVKYGGENGMEKVGQMIHLVGIDNAVKAMVETYQEGGNAVPDDFKMWMRQALRYLIKKNKINLS